MLRGIVLRWIVIFLAVIVAGYLVPDLVRYSDLGQVALFAIVLALLNAIIRPVLLLVTCPINLLTLGLFTLVVNALMFWLAGLLTGGVSVEGFLGAFVGALIVSVVSFVMNRVVS